MLRRLLHSPGVLIRAALGVVCLGVAIAANAQTGSDSSDPVVLGDRESSKLVLDHPKPEYPPLARVNYIQGQVKLQVKVTPDGKVSGLHILRGHPFLAAASLKAVRHWVFRPYRTRAGATAFVTLVNVNFSLHVKDISTLPPEPESFLDRQVRRPALLQKPGIWSTAEVVRLHVLVGPDGHAMDSELLSGVPSLFDAARKAVEDWKFQPARWGNQSVPWYLDVDVPVQSTERMPVARAAAGPDGK